MTDHAAVPVQLDNAFFQRLFEDAGLAIFACDLDGNIAAWNPPAHRLFETHGGESAKPRVASIIPDDQHEELAESFRQLLETHEPLEIRTCLTASDGEATEYALWLTPVFNNDEIDCVAVWFHNITARIQLRRSVRKRERLTTLGALSGSVAHHYNNLLCSITTSLDLALHMNTMSAMRRVLQRTSDALTRATQLTQQLLAFAQGDHRMCDLADLTEVVLQYFDQHEADLQSYGIELKLEWDRIPCVPLPRDQFMIVIDNIVQNAIEAMPTGGKLSVLLTQRDERSVLFSVSDSGAGIPAEHMEHLFEPFFTTKGELAAGDTHQPGMGLAVAHGLVSDLHGTIAARNISSGGTRVEIVLPLEDPSKQ